MEIGWPRKSAKTAKVITQEFCPGAFQGMPDRGESALEMKSGGLQRPRTAS
jgi:hypothetical protein